MLTYIYLNIHSQPIDSDTIIHVLDPKYNTLTLSLPKTQYLISE